MKVALIVEWLDPWRGGAETSTCQFLRHILDLGVELEIYTRSRSASAPGMAIHTVRSPSPSRLRSSRLFPTRAAAAVRNCNCDLVHSIVPSPCADIYQPRGGTVAETVERNLALRQSSAARCLKHLANRLSAKQRSRLRLERTLLERTPRPVVVAVSDYVERQLIRHYGFPPSHIRKVFNGVDPDTADAEQRSADRADIRKLHNIGDGETLAIMVAHNFKLKGVRRWIDALTDIDRHNRRALRSLIIGKENPVHWQRLTARLGLGHRVQFAGPTRRVQAYYHAADFLVHPTYYDPCSRVVLESMASRLPCITTRFDGASEVIEDGVNGFVVDSPDDVGAIVDRAVALTDPEVRRRLADSVGRCLDRITMRRHAEAMLRLYEDVLNNGGRS
ncbi:MAG: glycosyltransferase family 4 protein [Phycisphaerales bacterium]|nr:MAG: glycosyltransferase family 4 protein [Phycisphaerales bacterium]